MDEAGSVETNMKKKTYMSVTDSLGTDVKEKTQESKGCITGNIYKFGNNVKEILQTLDLKACAIGECWQCWHQERIFCNMGDTQSCLPRY